MWLIVVLSLSSCLINGNLAAFQVDILRNNFLQLEDTLWDFVIKGSVTEINDVDTQQMQLIKEFQVFDQEVQKLPQDPLYGMKVVQKAGSFLYLYPQLVKMNDLYDKFLDHQTHYMSLDNETKFYREGIITDIVDDVLYDKKNSVKKITQDIFHRLLEEGEDNVLGELAKILEDDFNCKNYGQTPQQVFYNLYNTLSLVDLKGYMLTQFSLLSQRIYEKENYTHISFQERTNFKNRTKESIVILRNMMKMNHRKLWRCDPKFFSEGDSYERLTRLLQIHIENEADLNQARSCKQSCSIYWNVRRSFGCYESDSGYCKKRKACNGRLLACREASKTTACISGSSSLRRYEYLETRDGTILGRYSWCTANRVPSWTRWFVYCSACMCICDEEGSRSDRYFNLRPVMADTAKNRVVTGLRIQKHNRIIHLQIQEGQLLPYGYINQSTVHWVPLDDYRITDYHSVEEDRDFYKMTFEKRILYMDDLMSYESDHIVTGVSFIRDQDSLKLQINVRKFNFETGQLDIDSHHIYGSGTNRNKIDLSDADIPIIYPKSNPIFDADKYIEFTHTSLSTDAGQTTIPYFDIQSVTTQPATPLKSVGIYWKGRKGSGGFIAPIITTFNYEEHMGVLIPDPKKHSELSGVPNGGEVEANLVN